MVSESSPSMTNCTNAVSGQSGGRSTPSTKISKKAPKKQHKAIREKMKRDHLNELFLELDQALEASHENNGKASILVEATRLLRDLIAHVEALRKENVALVNESLYVNGEKNELQDEKNVLKAEVEKLQNDLQERRQSDPMEEWQNKLDLVPPMLPHSFTTAVPMQQQPTVPLYDIVLHQDLNSTSEAGTSPPSPKAAPSKVSRPHPRYPTSSDVWSLELLSRNQRAAHEAQNSSGNSSNSREEALEMP
ncbi:transcription factor bHLH47 [Canna indica]|uniref:Transcription factor bHLH47 n=1 Tax=Canna indica TaxID=4628 RepID=A0AAQ3Q7J6_9LILI|nr:transcription factor bHLH47 [Canna indica]